MVSSTVRLPDGQTFTVVTVFGGLLFKNNELNTHHTPFPVGWTVVLQTEGEGGGGGEEGKEEGKEAGHDQPSHSSHSSHSHSHTFRRPTLNRDSLLLSSVSNPSASEFKPPASPTRQTAMMLWVALYWYFQQPAPDAVLPPTRASRATAAAGRPRGEWRIRVRREGMLRVRHLIPKLERMGLIATDETAPAGGADNDDDPAWDTMYVSRSMFWQIPPQLFLFTLQPIAKGGASPAASRPGSPALEGVGVGAGIGAGAVTGALAGAVPGTMTVAATGTPPGPFFSTSHLPTYYPPGPLRYTVTDGVRHPARPKPPRMGEVFYTRFVPSAGQYLSLRVASLSPRPVPYLGPVGPGGKGQGPAGVPSPEEAAHLLSLSDTALLQRWLAKPRVQAFWGAFAPDFLPRALASRHSFPVVGLWDGVPFGYFEIYWVKEDVLGRLVGAAAADDFDRGLHVFVGEEWARGRVALWLSSIVQWILCSDYRTMSVCIEPRVDNERFIQHLQAAGFNKQREVTFPHKQSWFGRLLRDGWEGPAL